MKKINVIIIALLLIVLAAGCVGQSTDAALKITPPRNLKLPLQGNLESCFPAGAGWGNKTSFCAKR
ncbi:MAG: hypothetical protein ACOYBM_03795 [Dethiobacteria bacterium]|nr:hypothetical protein [Bacillota bacterium]